MQLFARLLAASLWTAALAAPPAALSLWPASAQADDEGEDACGDSEEDVDPPSDEPEEPEPAE